MEFSITVRGGSTPFHTFFFIYFMTVKWQFSVKFEGFFYSVLPSNQTFDSITFQYIFEQPNYFKYQYTPFSLIPNVVKCIKKQRKFVPWMLNKHCEILVSCSDKERDCMLCKPRVGQSCTRPNQTEFCFIFLSNPQSAEAAVESSAY